MGCIKKKILFIFLLLFLTLSAVSAQEDNLISDDDNLTVSSDDSLKQIDLDEIDEKSDVETEGTVLNKYSADKLGADSDKVFKFSANDISSTYGKEVKFTVKVLNSKGKAVKNKMVEFKVAGKSYNVTSDSNGMASLTLKLNAGNNVIKYFADDVSGSNSIKIKNAYKIKVYKWKSGALVSNNKQIKKRIPNSKLVKKIVKLTKKGTPMIKFKGGTGKKVFITAGVHGNEISSQVAAMRLIKYLKNHPVNGTVYVMPFINPKATASNVRDYNGVHLNQKANVKGTISYKTVQLIKKFKCNAYGDFHCTRPGGDPGRNVAMGTYAPTYQSAVMAKYISQKSNVHLLIYSKAGAEIR